MKELRIKAPELCEEEALRAAIRYMNFRKEKKQYPMSLFKQYGFSIREFKHYIHISVFKKKKEA